MRYYMTFDTNNVCSGVYFTEDEILSDGIEIPQSLFFIAKQYGCQVFTYDSKNNKVKCWVPKLDINIKDTNGNIIKYTQVNTAVTVEIKLMDITDNVVITKYSGSYLVPYSTVDWKIKGTLKIDITNGSGSKQITFNESGIYSFLLTRIKNAKTLTQPSPLPIFSNDIFDFYVYE